jgi:chromosome segregation ATPase
MTKINQDLTEQIEKTSDLLTELETELLDIPNRRAVAVNDADSASLIALSHRGNDLPVEIRMTKIRLERLHVQRQEESLPSIQAEIERLYEPVEALQKKYDDAAKELADARWLHSQAIERRKDALRMVVDLKNGIQVLMH